MFFLSRYLNASTCAALGSIATEPSNTCLSPAGSPGSTSPSGSMYGVINKPSVTWNNYNVLSTSSALDRTLLSLRSFLAVSLRFLRILSYSVIFAQGEEIVIYAVLLHREFFKTETLPLQLHICPLEISLCPHIHRQQWMQTTSLSELTITAPT